MIYLLLIVLLIAVFIILREYHLRRLAKEMEELINHYMVGDFSKRLFVKEQNPLAKVVARLNEFAEIIENRIRDLEAEKLRWNSLLKGLSDAVVLINEDNRIELVNEAFLKELDVNEQDILHRRYSEVLRNTDLIELIDRSIQTGTTQRAEIVFDEKERLYRATAYPIQIENGINVIMILRDLTERRQIERVKRDFIANVSHELKTPITTIKGYIETLMDEVVEDRDRAKEFLEIAYRNVVRMERLVEDLINLTGIESGVVRIEKRKVNLKEIFEELLKEFRPKASKKGLQICIDLEDETTTIQADPLRLRQILGNLVDNAIKFTESGAVTIGVKHTDGMTTLYVQDTGIGIPKEYLPRLGERFFRVDPSRSRALGGTGLGLAIVKHLVLAHGWRMSIDSQPNKGTRVNIHIDS